MKIKFVLLALLFLVPRSVAQEEPPNTTPRWNLDLEKAALYETSPDGSVIAVTTEESSVFNINFNERRKGALLFLDAGTGKVFLKLAVCEGKKFGDGSFSNNGRYWAVSCQTGKAQVWDLRNARIVNDFYPLAASQIEIVNLSPDGKRLITFENSNSLGKFTDDRVVLRDTLSGKAIAELYPSLTTGNKDANKAADFSNDSSLVAVSYNTDVYLWNANNGKLIRKLIDKRLGSVGSTHGQWVFNLKFSPDRTRLTTGSKDTIFKVWNTKTGELELRLEGHKSQGTAIAFSPDGKLVATASWDRTVKLWSVSDGSLKWSTTLKHSALRMAFTDDGMKLFATEPVADAASLLEVNSGKATWQGRGRWVTAQVARYLVTYEQKKRLFELFELR